MNIHQLFTASGLAQAIQAHHKHLHTQYNFPPLSGQKPLHKLAETFGYNNAEPFMAKLAALSARMLSTSVNLSANGKSVLLHVEVLEDDGDHQIRVMAEGDRAFLICTVSPELLAPAMVSYDDSAHATVFIGAFAITLELEADSVEVALFEASNVNDVVSNTFPTEGEDFALVDQQTYYMEEDDLLGWTREDEEDMMDSFMSALYKPASPKGETVIPASVTTDDDNVTLVFDAVAYFESELKNGNIETVFASLEGCDFDADYPTDTIAEFFSDSATKRLFDYLSAVDEALDIGYRCTIDKQAAFVWLHNKVSERLGTKKGTSDASPPCEIASRMQRDAKRRI